MPEAAEGPVEQLLTAEKPAEAPPAATAKKARRALGLAVGLGKETSVMVQSVGKAATE